MQYKRPHRIRVLHIVHRLRSNYRGTVNELLLYGIDTCWLIRMMYVMYVCPIAYATFQADTIARAKTEGIVKPHYTCTIHAEYKEYQEHLLNYKNWSIVIFTFLRHQLYWLYVREKTVLRIRNRIRVANNQPKSWKLSTKIIRISYIFFKTIKLIFTDIIFTP